jgi:hypothetical protein
MDCPQAEPRKSVPGMLTCLRYMERYHFKEAAKFFRMGMKEQHTIVEQWPMKLELRPGEPGTQEKFNILLSSGHSATERYVEDWKRTV